MLKVEYMYSIPGGANKIVLFLTPRVISVGVVIHSKYQNKFKDNYYEKKIILQPQHVPCTMLSFGVTNPVAESTDYYHRYWHVLQ